MGTPSIYARDDITSTSLLCIRKEKKETEKKRVSSNDADFLRRADEREGVMFGSPNFSNEWDGL